MQVSLDFVLFKLNIGICIDSVKGFTNYYIAQMNFIRKVMLFFISLQKHISLPQ